ncbi:MAG: UDP-3-O-(3-hydroxymyristoyl)glucosamine N-acyltransferase [Calditerrivibrio sp.]|nr:UDP-3-O-(3-hydroxymyristoyl)glucosamine N-acyltransferase [Calditerrivibrio sp.]
MENQKEIKLSKLADLLKGELVGEDLSVSTFSSVEEPKKNSIVLVTNRKYLKYIEEENIVAAVITKSVKSDINKPFILVEDDPLIMVKLLDIFYPQKPFYFPKSVQFFIGEGSSYGKDCLIEDFVYIGRNTIIGDSSIIRSGVKIGSNVRIGKNVVLNNNVVLYDDTVIGDNVIIHANATIGADGFGYVNLPDGHVKIRQVGNVVIGSNVEIGANSCIDRGALGATVIGDGTKIDNLVQIGHNCKIGKNCIIVSQAGIAGSCKLGDYVIIAGQVGIGDHVKIADGTVLLARSAVMSDIDEKGVYCGAPPMDVKLFMKNTAVFKELYELKKIVQGLLEDKKCT